MLSKDDILNADDRKTQVVDVPEWGGQVTIKEMSGFARDRFETSIMGKNGGANMQNIRSKLVIASVIDESGNLMFTEKDINKLSNKSGAALDRIYDAVQKLNKITDADVDELAKNSLPDPSDNTA